MNINITPTPSPVASHFGTTLRVTTEAVELRDRSYRLDSVRSARATRVRSNRDTLVFIFVLAAVVLVILYVSLRIALDADPNIMWTGFGIAALLVGLSFNMVLIIGLIIFYRSAMKGWHYIYIARLQRTLWHTDIAVSFHPEPIDRVVAAVNQGLKMVRNGDAPAEPATLYYEEHGIRVEDSGIDVDGRAYSIDAVRHAASDPVRIIPWYLLILNYLGVFFAISIFNNISEDISAYLRMALFIGIGLSMLLVLLVVGRLIQHVNKDKHMPGGGAHECKLHTASETLLVFASIDREFSRAAVDAVNAAVQKHRASSNKRQSATSASQQSTL